MKKHNKDAKDDGGFSQGFWHQVSWLLRWFSKRVFPLAGFLFVLTYQYLRTYFADEGIPLNVLSESIFVALPAFFLMVLFFILAVVFSVFFQTHFLFVPVWEGGSENLLDILRKKKKYWVIYQQRVGVGEGLCGGPVIKGFSDFRNKFFLKAIPGSFANIFLSILGVLELVCVGIKCLYVFLFVKVDSNVSPGQKIFGLCIFAFLFPWIALSIFNYRYGGMRYGSLLFWGIVFWSLSFMVFQGFWLLRGIVFNKKQRNKKLSDVFCVASILSISVQLFFICNAMALIFDWFGRAAIAPAIFGYFFIVALFTHQFSLANNVKNGGEMLKKVGAYVMVLATIIAVFPPFSNYLTGKVLSEAASGHRKCAVLLWTESEPESVANIQRQNNGRESVDLRILAEIDGYYLVRENEIDAVKSGVKPKVNYVSRSLVAGIRTCVPAPAEINDVETLHIPAVEHISTN